ncbi:MAG: hypothetical protein P9L99_17300 [Candidatus Lernaella stagnicola]|nr:hypothetical protein [Candidatus Lernaella stagnicola]
MVRRIGPRRAGVPGSWSELKQERILRTRIFIAVCVLIAGMALCQCGGKQQETAPKTPTPQNAEEAKTPQLIAAPANPQSIADDSQEGFRVTIDKALLFDPRMGPINAKLSSDVGVHLLVTGRIRNETGRLLHRAKIYATVMATFSERTEIERHSGGLGFSPRVTSLDPWRPDTERSFTCLTRPLDPIYLELVPEKIRAALTLTAHDPLTYRFRGEVEKMSISWDPVLGMAAEGEAFITGDGDAVCAPLLRRCPVTEGRSVAVLYQRGTAFKVIDEEKRLLWLRHDQLRFTSEPQKAKNDSPATPSFPVRTMLPHDLEFDVTNVAEYETHPDIKTKGKVFVVGVRLTNRGERPVRTPRATSFVLDLAGGAYAEAVVPRNRGDNIYRSTTLKPQDVMRASLFFVKGDSEWDFPFELELHERGAAPARWPLFPVLLAAQQSNGK